MQLKKNLFRKRGQGLITLRTLGVAIISALCLVSWAKADPAPLRVGLTGKYPPFNYWDNEGKLVGFDVDVAQWICAQIQRPCEFKTLQWDGILASLLAHKIDVVIGSMSITPEREKQVLFSAPYTESGVQLFVRESSKAPDSPGFRIGATLGTTYADLAKIAFPKAELVIYRGDLEILQDITAGRIDGLLFDRLAGFHAISRMGEGIGDAGLTPWGRPLQIERIAIPIRKSEPELKRAIDDAIVTLRGSATYPQLLKKHFGEKATIATESGTGTQGSPLGLWARLLFKGLLGTLWVSVLGLALGLVLAILLALGAIQPRGFLPRAIQFWNDFIRATPFLIQLFTLYFGLAPLGLKLTAFQAAVIALGIHSSAYLSELFKTTYLAIPQAQHWAAFTLGLNRSQTFQKVLFPQMLPVLTPSALNTLVSMIKDSAVVSVISVYELTVQTQSLIASTFRPFEFYITSAFLYALLTFPLLRIGRKLERRAQAKGLLHGAR
jgi:His/Glu/Gln/Arg/opine family amino acid ABC transporter permease subunit